jgi:hypothetical protein
VKRSAFIKTTLTAGLAGSVLPAIASAENSVKDQQTEFYELRVYTLKDETQQKLVEDYFQKAAIPALNKLGSKNVGVFTEMKPQGQTKIYAIIPFKSTDAFFTAQNKLLADASYRQAGAAYLNATAAAPAYDRIESSLLQAFKTTPNLLPTEKKQRFFELRRYESASEITGKKKIEMFNEAGESAIFKRLGFKPVFFAETLIGEMRPNLTYMITFDDMADHDAKWKSFGSDAEWKRISTMPEYSDKLNVSRITSTFLVPTAYSQI